MGWRAWHGTRARGALATLGHSGKVYCWARIYRQAWSAFAPDFTELDENEVGPSWWPLSSL